MRPSVGPVRAFYSCVQCPLSSCLPFLNMPSQRAYFQPLPPPRQRIFTCRCLLRMPLRKASASLFFPFSYDSSSFNYFGWTNWTNSEIGLISFYLQCLPYLLMLYYLHTLLASTCVHMSFSHTLSLHVYTHQTMSHNFTFLTGYIIPPLPLGVTTSSHFLSAGNLHILRKLSTYT